MQKFFDSMGIKLPALSIPQIQVSQETWILGLGILLGVVVAVALIRHRRIRLAERHLAHKMKNSGTKGVSFNGDTKTVSVVHSSGETEISRSPYKHGKLPAQGFEGFTHREIANGALRIAEQPHVVTSFWKTAKRARKHWKVEPTSASPVMTDTPPLTRRQDRQKQAPAAASDGRNRDQRPDRDQRPEQPAPATLQ